MGVGRALRPMRAWIPMKQGRNTVVCGEEPPETGVITLNAISGALCDAGYGAVRRKLFRNLLKGMLERRHAKYTNTGIPATITSIPYAEFGQSFLKV
jgi:hypothetical protein